MTITNTTCHTWTHNVGGKLRVECVAHGVVCDTTREDAPQAQRDHAVNPTASAPGGP